MWTTIAVDPLAPRWQRDSCSRRQAWEATHENFNSSYSHRKPISPTAHQELSAHSGARAKISTNRGERQKWLSTYPSLPASGRVAFTWAIAFTVETEAPLIARPATAWVGHQLSLLFLKPRLMRPECCRNSTTRKDVTTAWATPPLTSRIGWLAWDVRLPASGGSWGLKRYDRNNDRSGRASCRIHIC